jgi:YcaO-like protein with predicted kinase domain
MAAGPWLFTSTLKVEGARSVPLELTLARVRALAPRVPVTRVVDLTPLDFLRLPVYSAVTPLARDLKVHLGKGESRMAARVSALMEAVERVSAEDVFSDVVRAPFEELVSAGAVDPSNFDLPDDTAYRPDMPLDWVRGRDLIQGQDVLIPVDFAITPPRQGVLRDVDTNGLAAGNIHLEAVTHAICEVVERDAFSQIQFAASFGEPHDQPPNEVPVDLTTLPAPSREWAERIESADMDLDVLDITTDLGVPTFQALLIDEHYPAPDGGFRPAGFFGLGTHPDPEVAVFRALSEAIQARGGIIHAARDSYNDDRTVPRAAAIAVMHARTRYRRRRPFSETQGFVSMDLLAEFGSLVNRLACAGVRHCVVVDLTRQDWGIPVVRVCVAGLSQYCVNKRRPGTRCLRYLL